MKIDKTFTSLVIVIIILLTLGVSLFYNCENRIVTTYDAFGYYMYLPSAFIYQDFKKLNWKKSIDEEYAVFGGDFYQANLYKGSFVNKYYCGVAIMQSPFFLMSHIYAIFSGHKSDGFSKPYQIGITFSSIFYFIFGLLLLGSVLLNYYNDSSCAIALFTISIPTNILQYICIDSGQSHAYLFFLYCLIIYTTFQWHKQPSKFYAGLLGFSIGLAICCRPTELVSIFIPVFWKLTYKNHNKWKYLKNNKEHLALAVIAGSIALLPQFIYWLHTTGQFIYNVGSKWQFLNPFFRVLFGGEKGWFLYTPITIFLILALLFQKQEEYSKSLRVFCILNIWIVISWYDWRYGGSYSTRALSQSLPIFALPFAAKFESIKSLRLRHLLLITIIYLSITNLFQIFQYNKTIIHYNDMNFKYYSKVYWNTNPTPLTFSLLDTEDWHNNYTIVDLIHKDQFRNQDFKSDQEKLLVRLDSIDYKNTSIVKSNIDLEVSEGYWNAFIRVRVQENELTLHEQKIRLEHPLASYNAMNQYSFFTDIPNDCKNCQLVLDLQQDARLHIDFFAIEIESIKSKK